MLTHDRHREEASQQQQLPGEAAEFTVLPSQQLFIEHMQDPRAGAGVLCPAPRLWRELGAQLRTGTREGPGQDSPEALILGITALHPKALGKNSHFPKVLWVHKADLKERPSFKDIPYREGNSQITVPLATWNW